MPAASIYLWGPAGVGKTHLLQALVAAFCARGDSVLAVDAVTVLPWDWTEATVLAVVDGCESLDAARQHAAFAIYVEAAGAGVPIVAAGRLRSGLLLQRL